MSWISANSSSLPEVLARSKGGQFPTQARRRPTRTWASLDSNFTYPKYTRPDGDFSLGSISLEFADDTPDPFGRVTGSSITIRGWLGSSISVDGDVKEFFDPHPHNYQHRICILLGSTPMSRDCTTEFWLALV
jgi:hypothetical protein